MIASFRWKRKDREVGRSTSTSRSIFEYRWMGKNADDHHILLLGTVAAKAVGLFLGSLFRITMFLALLYSMVAAPPLHLFYPIAAPAGESSVYVAGAGFPGFWFHLGFLQSLPSLQEHDFYCFSSGCLSVVMAMANITLDTAVNMTFDIQQHWQAGHLSRYDMVHRFFDDIVSHVHNDDDDDTNIHSIVERIHVLATTVDEGVTIQTASTVAELRDLLIRTTWIPFVTGRSMWHMDSSGRRHLDGAFSRWLHPKCEYDLSVPLTWDTVAHALNPALERRQVYRLWESGQGYNHSLMTNVRAR